jgi:hypothetical protein
MKKIVLAFALVYTLFSCEKDEIGANDKNTLSLEFENLVGAEPLVLNTKTYKNASNEDFTVSTFNFFVSNITLKKTDGTSLKLDNQYFLVKQSDPKSLELELTDIPAGDYSSISYVVGVDSAKSTSDISQRTGVLDPASYGTDGMYWSWNSGYIFFKLEGSSNASTASDKHFKYHIGGFGGMSAATANNLKTIEINLKSNPATVRSNIAPVVHISTDIMEVFSSSIKISSQNEIMSPTLGLTVSKNYQNMFSLEHVHNDKM